jgi:hypothetical protein
MDAGFRSAKFDAVVFDTAWPSTRAPDRPFGRIGSRLDASAQIIQYLQLKIILNYKSRVNRTNLVLSNSSALVIR